MPGKFYPPPSNFPQSDLGRRADSRWALPQISSFFKLKVKQKCTVAPRGNGLPNKHRTDELTCRVDRF